MNYDTEQRPSLATHLEVVAMMAEHTVFELKDFSLVEARKLRLEMEHR